MDTSRNYHLSFFNGASTTIALASRRVADVNVHVITRVLVTCVSHCGYLINTPLVLFSCTSPYCGNGRGVG